MAASPRRCASAAGLPDPEQAFLTGGVENIDDFSACKITRKEDWVELYSKPYYFGCEADDRMNATAFGRNNPFGSKLNAIFSSDIGHFDVIDMRDPLPEAYELVEDGHITADNFRDFTFANAVQAVGHAEPEVLRRHARRQRSRRRARRCANPNPRRRRITQARQRRCPAALLFPELRNGSGRHDHAPSAMCLRKKRDAPGPVQRNGRWVAVPNKLQALRGARCPRLTPKKRDREGLGRPRRATTQR